MLCSCPNAACAAYDVPTWPDDDAAVCGECGAPLDVFDVTADECPAWCVRHDQVDDVGVTKHVRDLGRVRLDGLGLVVVSLYQYTGATEDGLTVDDPPAVGVTWPGGGVELDGDGRALLALARTLGTASDSLSGLT